MKKKEEEEEEAVIWSYNVLGLEKLSNQKKQNYNKLKEKLACYLDQLIVEDFNKLISILYRIDIDQEKARAALEKISGKESAGETIAKLIIARQLQKIKTRWEFS